MNVGCRQRFFNYPTIGNTCSLANNKSVSNYHQKVSSPIHQRQSIFWQGMPLFGSILFSLLYFIATLYYPGGTFLNKNSRGFSWAQNYWCNLLSENALNGQPNPARPIAFTAMAVISLTLIIFWYMFPRFVSFKTKQRYVIQASGFMAMVTGIFVFTSFHDAIINIAGVFGLIALTGTLIGLRKLGWKGLLYMGLFILLLIGLNNLFYYKKDLMYYLAVVQKITFLFFLFWICLINIRWLNKPAINTCLIE